MSRLIICNIKCLLLQATIRTSKVHVRNARSLIQHVSAANRRLQVTTPDICIIENIRKPVHVYIRFLKYTLHVKIVAFNKKIKCEVKFLKVVIMKNNVLCYATPFGLMGYYLNKSSAL